MSERNTPIYVEGLEAVVSNYDAFIVDQWGVLHDGKKIFPGIIEALSRIRDFGKPCVIMTNSGKTSQYNKVRLESMGLSPDFYTGLVSSAEVLRTMLLSRKDLPWSKLGNRAFLVANKEDYPLIQGTPYVSTPNVEDADFVLLLSTNRETSASDHERWINVAIRRKLPVFSISDDPLTFGPDGLFSGSASLIKTIRQEGGLVINTGKPDSLIYEHCMQFFPGIDRAKILAIGDQVETDVVGARRFGLHAALVLSGASEGAYGNATTPEEVRSLVSRRTAITERPNWVLPKLAWKNEETSCRSEFTSGSYSQKRKLDGFEFK